MTTYEEKLTEAFKAVKEKKVYPDYGNFLYYELVEVRKHVSFTPQQKIQYIEIAGHQLVSEKEAEALKEYGPKILTIQKTIDDLYAAETDQAKEMIRARAKRLLVNRAIEDFIELNVEPQDLF